MKTFAVLVILGVCAFGFAAAGRGAKTHNDACNVIGDIVQVFSQENYAESCDKDKGLICYLNRCDCVPGFTWRQNVFESTLGFGGVCSGASVASSLSALVAIATAFLLVRGF